MNYIDDITGIMMSRKLNEINVGNSNRSVVSPLSAAGKRQYRLSNIPELASLRLKRENVVDKFSITAFPLSLDAMSGKGDAKESVYKYLQSQNRPYSANDVMHNLHNEFGKAAVQKALDDLSRESKIIEKVYGKQKVYSVVQCVDDGGGDMETELLQLDSEIEKLAESLKKAENELKANEVTLKELRKQPSREQCLREKKELEDDITSLTEKIQNLTESDVNITERERTEVSKNNDISIREYKKRKRICMDILNSILENCPKPKKALFEEIGIETDEDVGFKMQLC